MHGLSPHRPIRTIGIVVVLGSLLGACAGSGGTIAPSGGTSSPSPAPSAASPTVSPAQSASPSTAPDASPSQGASSGAGVPVGLVLRLTWCQDVCVSNPGTTILADGRVIWRSEDGDWVARRLTADGLAQVRQRIDATGALGGSAEYKPQLKPGPEPPGHGTTSYTFRLVRDGVPVLVNTGEPLEPEYWVNPPQMEILSEFARGLMDPEGALPADAWAGEAEPFTPPAYLLFVGLRPGEIPPPDLKADVDDVDWPFEAPIDQVGAPFARNGDVSSNDRCMPVSAVVAEQIAAAEGVTGRPRELADTLSELEYPWARGDGFAIVGLQWLMPDQAWGCSASLDW